MASGCRPADDWKRLNAIAVAGVKRPSTDAGGSPKRNELELERRDIPSDRADLERTLTEQRVPQLPERAPRLRTDAAVGDETLASLKGHDRTLSDRSLDPVNRPGVEPLRSQRNLEGGNACGRGAGRSGEKQTGERRRRRENETAHGHRFALRRPRPSP